MTEDESREGIGGLAQDYADTRRQIACLRHRLSSHHDSVLGLLHAVQEAQTRGYGSVKHACATVAWDELRTDADKLAALGEKRERLEGYLREAALGELIQ